MGNREELQRELVKALIKSVECEERLKEFQKPMLESMNKGEWATFTFTLESVGKYERLYQESLEAHKEYHALLRKYVEGNRQC